MPESDGLEILAKARTEGLLPPAIAISSPDTIMDLLPTARLLGAAATLQKPLTAERLLDTVTEVLGRGPPDRAAAGAGPSSEDSPGASD
jgi:DNA-binding response OmpR family regulator